ncbi:hypothetical protein EGW08_011575, partial [Elysia chlorotica]
QQLETSAGERTFLCTDFVRVLPSEETLSVTVTDSPDSDTTTQQLSVRAVWDCPCARDSRLPTSSCPAVKRPSSIFTYQQIIHGNFSHAQVNQTTPKGKVTFQSVHCVSPRW